jgi:hypothetical protein
MSHLSDSQELAMSSQTPLSHPVRVLEILSSEFDKEELFESFRNAMYMYFRKSGAYQKYVRRESLIFLDLVNPDGIGCGTTIACLCMIHSSRMLPERCFAMLVRAIGDFVDRYCGCDHYPSAIRDAIECGYDGPPGDISSDDEQDYEDEYEMSQFSDREDPAMSGSSLQATFVDDAKDVIEEQDYNAPVAYVTPHLDFPSELSAKAKPYIPKYTPSISRVQLMDILDPELYSIDELYGLLFSKGYPMFWIKSIIQNMQGSNPGKRLSQLRNVQDRRVKYEELETKRHFVKGAATKAAAHTKNSGKFWRIRAPPHSPLVPKPVFFTPHGWRLWVYGQAFALTKVMSRKTQYVTGNEACAALFYMVNNTMTSRGIAQLMSEAKVYLADYTQESRQPHPLTLDAFFPVTRSLRVAGSIVSSVQELDTFQSLFSRNKPLFRFARAFLDGDDSVDAVKLQQQLDAKTVKVVLQGAVQDDDLCEILENLDQVVEDPFPFAFSETLDVPLPFSMNIPLDQLQPYEYHAPCCQPLDLESMFIVSDAQFESVVNCIVEQLEFEFGMSDSSSDTDSESSVELQGGINSKLDVGTPTDFTIAHKIDAGELISELSGAIGHFATAAGERVPSGYERIIVQITSFLVGLYNADNWKSAVACLVQFASGNDYVWSCCSSLIKRVKANQVVELQGMQEVKDWFASLADEIKVFITEAAAACSISTLLSSCAESFRDGICGVLPDLVAAVRFSVLRETGSDVAKWCLAMVKECLHRVSSCISQRSFAPIWGSRWNPMDWIKEVQTMITHFPILTCGDASSPSTEQQLMNLRKQGLIAQHWTHPLPLGEFVIRAHEHHEQGRKIAHYFVKTPTVANDILRVLHEFRHFLDSIVSNAASLAIRVAPFLVQFTSELGGTGKTGIASSLTKAIGNLNGFDIKDGIYSWQPNQNFQSGLNHVHWAISMNDPDQNIAPPSANVRNHIEEILALRDNSPYSVEQADAALKGKIRANPLFMTYTTNYFDGRVHDYCKAPSAYWRRIGMHVVVNAKPEFSSGQGLLDPSKASASESHDMWDLHVRYFDPRKIDSSNVKCVPMSDPVKMSFPEFVVKAQAMYTQHMERERARMLALAKLGPHCSVCGLDLDKDCGHNPVLQTVELQGRFNPCTKLKDWFNDKWMDTQMWLEDMRLRVGRAVAENMLLIFMGGAATIAALVAASVFLVKFSMHQLQGRENNAIGGMVPASWTRASQEFIPGIPPAVTASYTKDDIERVLKDSHFIVSGPEYTMNAYIFSHNVFIVPTHVGKIGETLELKFPHNPQKVVIGELNRMIFPSNPELCLIRCGELRGSPGIGSKCWEVVDEAVQQFDEVEIWSSLCEYKPQTNAMRMMGSSKVLSTSAITKSGDCGCAYLARFGKTWKIRGIHFALVTDVTAFETVQTSRGALVSMVEARRLIQSMGTTLQGVSSVPSAISKVPEVADCVPFSHRSEVYAAMSHHNAHFYPYGQLDPPASGGSFTSGCAKSLIYQEVSDRYEAEWCGYQGYWTIPDFRGTMVEGKWVSPYTLAFAAENRAISDDYVSWVALADYLTGVERLDCSGYAVLSEEQVLKGIPCSFVHAVNQKTSMGPPFNRSKRHYLAITAEECAMDPEVWRLWDELELILEQGHIPRPSCIWVPKDEPLALGKAPRIFCNLNAPFNFVAKRYGLWKDFMRSNPEFFECYVGIDMTSATSNTPILRMAAVDPTLTKLCDKDGRKMDKSWKGDMWDFTALSVYAMSYVIGCAPMKNYQLVHSCKHTIHSIKNDLISVFHNPSGCDATVQFNSLEISRGERYVYYRNDPRIQTPEVRAEVKSWIDGFFTNPVPNFKTIKLDYRENNALATYGDDNLGASRVLLPNQEEIWASEIGIVMTDGSKVGSIRQKPLEDVSFLKRAYVFDSELGMYLPPLSKKSLARTLLIRKPSTLSERDACADSCTQVLKEAVYHGKEFYEELFAFLSKLLKEKGLLDNPYLRLRTFEQHRQDIKDGKFRTWTVDEKPVTMADSSDVKIELQSKMTSPQIVNGGNDPANTAEILSSSTSVVHDTGTITSDSSFVQNNNPATPQFFQTMPTNDLSDFPTRATEIATVTLTSTDSGIMTTFDPWALFLANPRMVDKTAAYAYIRGTIQLIAVIAVPGTAFGSYVISALPNAGPTNDPVAPTLLFQNVMQVDHYARIDIASAENVVLQLPFLWPYDFASLPTGPALSWAVSVSCLSAIKTSIPGGNQVGSIRIFANLLDDYVLAVPHLQGKPALRANHAMKTMAPKVHERVSKASSAVSMIEDTANKLSGVPIIGPYAETAAKAAHSVKKVMGWFGFTRETDERPPIVVTNRSVTNVAHMEGSDSSDVAALAMINEISTDGSLAGFSSNDCLATADFFSRWTLVKQATWSPDAAVGTVITSIPVSPMYGSQVINDADMYGFVLTTAGYFGIPFQYWRGDMEYLIIIPVGKLHRGSLQLLWLPVGSTLTATVTNTTLNAIYDVSAGGEKIVSVGYARDLPYLETRIITDSLTIVPQGSTNGQLYLRVINPIISPNSSAAIPVDVLIFARAKPNLEFAVPGSEVIYMTPDGSGLDTYDLRSHVVYQGALGDEDQHAPEPVELVKASGEYPAEKLLFGERIESIRALLQKPSQLFSYEGLLAQENISTNMPQFGPHIWGSGFVQGASADVTGWTWQAWFRVCFTGMATSERIKVFPESECWLGASHWTELSFGASLPSSVSTLAPMTFCGPNKGAEFLIPYYTPKKFELSYDRQDTSFGQHRILRDFSSVMERRAVLYHAFGPDTRVTCFRQLPVMLLSKQVQELSPWFYEAS